VRILRQFDRNTAKTLQRGNSKATKVGAQAIAVPKSQIVKQGMTRTKGTVRRLFANDPYNKNSLKTVATFSKEADTFTNNPNPKFDPSKAPGGVSKVSHLEEKAAAQKPGKASRGHQKVISRTLFNQNQGKTLKRR
jgi:hypothetical protein